MMEEIQIPYKTLYNITIANKITDGILVSANVVAFNQVEAIRKLKVGSIIADHGLTREQVDFYIKQVGTLYDGKVLATPLAETPVLTNEELVFIRAKREYKLSALYGMTQAQLEAYISNQMATINNLTQAKTVIGELLKKMAAVELWLVKQSKLSE